MGVAIGLGFAMREPRVVRYSVIDPRLPADLPVLRIVLLSDIHGAGPDMPRQRIEAIVDQVNRLRPDVVMLTGDYVSDKTLRTSTVSSEDATAPFASLRSTFGTFAVLGNHDHWRDQSQMTAALRRANIALLNNAHTGAGPFTVAGVDDVFTRRDDLKAALHGIDAKRPILLLSHSPDIFPEVDGRVGLTLAGHTHAGQIALPFVGPLFTASRYGNRFAHGHIVENGRHMIVSAGLGTSILPLRFGVPPEIVMVELRSAR